jgi:hypothetical protein
LLGGVLDWVLPDWVLLEGVVDGVLDPLDPPEDVY